jgi:hypothetical protein
VHKELLRAYLTIAHVYADDKSPEFKKYTALISAEITAVLKDDPNDLEVHMIYVDTLRDDAAIAELRKMVAQAPSLARAHFVLTRLLFGKGQIDEGAKSAARWLKTADLVDQVNDSVTLFGDLNVEQLREVLKINPSIYPAHLALSQLLMDSNLDAALHHAQAWSKLAPAAVVQANERIIDQALRVSGHAVEAEALHRQFAQKLKSPEQQ